MWWHRSVDRRPGRAYLGLATALVVACAAAYCVPAIRRTGGWPVPLDDVYIHFGFARSAALGRPFQWIPGNGYSSGGTSLTYPLLLAPAWLLGARGDALAIFAGLLACAALVDLCRSVRSLLRGRGAAAAWWAPPLLLCLPLLDWSWFSGMETAVLGAAVGRALVAVDRATWTEPAHRARAQRIAGWWAAALVATRPELLALAAPLAVAVAHGAGSLGTVSSLWRASAPTATLLSLQAIANRWLTGEWAAAGAVRKLVWSNPYLTGPEVALEVVKNLAVLRVQAFDVALGGTPWSAALPLLAACALLSRSTRRLAVALAVGAIGALALVSLNSTARFQNLRYATPSLMMLLLLGVLGIAALWRRGPMFGALGTLLGLVTLAAPARWFPVQVDHFARASGNIAGQQAEVARRLRDATPRPRRVLVGDAGAIPYLSEIPAIDGLGLGGYHALPFARASVHGVAAVVELLERLPDEERPDVMALYPGWWRGLADVFGRPVSSVRIEDNVICAADEKVVYASDWTSLEAFGVRRLGAVDEVDVADLVDERAHDYRAPTPRGGWVIGERRSLAGAPRFDAGRIVPEGRDESFTVGATVARGPTILVLRTDALAAASIEVRVVQRGAGASALASTATGGVPAATDGAWVEIEVPLPDAGAGDRIEIRAVRGAWRSFHVWLVR